VPPTSTLELADGSSIADAHPLTHIDRKDPAQRYRYRCPNNHTSWEKTNGGIWCASCSRQDLDPHYHKILDAKTDEHIPWSSVELR
jgi:hypothetical protein